MDTFLTGLLYIAMVILQVPVARRGHLNPYSGVYFIYLLLYLFIIYFRHNIDWSVYHVPRAFV